MKKSIEYNVYCKHPQAFPKYCEIWNLLDDSNFLYTLAIPINKKLQFLDFVRKHAKNIEDLDLIDYI